MMADAGCFSAQIGVQSLDADFKRKQVKRHEKNEDIARTVEIFKKYKIYAKFDHMFGLPGESLEAQEIARKFYIEHPPYSIQTYWTNYFPGTEMVQQGLDLGCITFEDVQKVNEGLECDIYSNGNSNIDKEKMRTYQAYQIIFKLLPNLPYNLRKRLKPQFFEKIPVGICSFISFVLDVIIGLCKLSPDHILYARYYLYHMTRVIFGKVGIKMPPATKVLNTEEYALYPAIKLNVSLERLQKNYKSVGILDDE